MHIREGADRIILTSDFITDLFDDRIRLDEYLDMWSLKRVLDAIAVITDLETSLIQEGLLEYV